MFRAIVGALALVGTCLVGHGDATDWWSTFHHDTTRAGFSTCIMPDTNHVKWSATHSGWVTHHGPVIADGLAYVAAFGQFDEPSWHNRLYCFDTETGDTVWMWRYPGIDTSGLLESTPTVGDGLVWVNHYTTEVYCHDAYTGDTLWHTDYSGGVGGYSSPAFADGRLYVTGSDELHCLDAHTGAVLWSSSVYFPAILGWSSPAVAYDLVYTGSHDSLVICWDALTGDTVWTYKTGGIVNSSPTVVDGFVFVGSYDDRVYCLDAFSGDSVWTYLTAGDVESSPAVAYDYGNVYVQSSDGELYCLDISDGYYHWSYPTGGSWSSPAIADDKVYNQGNALYCLDAIDGELIWSDPVGAGGVNPAIADDLLFVTTSPTSKDGDGELIAYGVPGPVPRIISKLPASSATNIPTGSSVSVTFDTDMNEATINSTTFVVHGRMSGFHPDAITYDSPTRTAILYPTAEFAEGEVVTVVVTTDISSSDGVPLDSGVVWSFRIVAEVGPGAFDLVLPYAVGDEPLSVIAARLDADSDIDLVTANPQSNDVSVLLNDGTGGFSPHSDYSVFYVPVAVFAADLDGDNDMDIITGSDNVLGDSISVAYNDGSGAFGGTQQYATEGRPVSVFAADFNGDGHIDVATAGRDSNSVSVLLNNGDGTLAAFTSYEVEVGPTCIIAADLDTDDDLDLATANSDSGSVSIIWNQGDGTFAGHATFEIGSYPASLIAADLNGDGFLDLAAADASDNEVSVLLGNGDGSFDPRSSYPVGGLIPVSVIAADIQGDGDLDLITANWESHTVSVLANQGDGSMASPAVYPIAGDYPTSIVSADLDIDGDIDLAVATEISDSVTVLYNWQPVCGDYEGDEDVDIGDLISLFSYLWSDGSAPSHYAYGDLDDYSVITWSDYLHLQDHLFGVGPPPDCDCDHDRLAGPVDTGCYLELVDALLPADDSTMTLHLNLTVARTVEIGSLPFRVWVGDDVPFIDACQLSPLLDPFDVGGRKFDEDSGRVLISFVGGTVGPFGGEVATIEIMVPPAETARRLSLEWAPFEPFYHDPPEYDSAYSHYPLLVEPDKTARTPHLVNPQSCCVLRGDINHDGLGPDIADLVYLVSFMFQPDSPAPPCEEPVDSGYYPETDVDGNWTGPDIADLVYLVSFMFQPPSPAPIPCP